MDGDRIVAFECPQCHGTKWDREPTIMALVKKTPNGIDTTTTTPVAVVVCATPGCGYIALHSAVRTGDYKPSPGDQVN